MEKYRTWATTPNVGKPTLSVVIPTYNEEWRILPTVGAIASFVSSIDFEWELIVSDDGSTDDTLALIRNLELANLRLLETARNTGKGGAVRRGVEAAAGDLILFADADQATPIEQLPALVDAIDKGADIAIGSRSHDDASVENKSLARKLLSGGLQAFVRLGFRLPYKDTQCGFKLFTAEAAKRLFSVQVIEGFSFDLELLYIAQRSGMAITEVPVEWHDAPGSTVDGGRDALKFLGDMPLILSNGVRGKYTLADSSQSASKRSNDNSERTPVTVR